MTGELKNRAVWPSLAALWKDRVSYGVLVRGQIWIIAIAIITALLLSVIVQIVELYRIIYADFDVGEMIMLALGITLMAASLGWAASVLSAMTLTEPGVSARIEPYARFQPFILAALPPLACGLGHFNAVLHLPAGVDQLQVVGSPWLAIVDDLQGSFDLRLWIAGGLYVAASCAVLAYGYISRHRKIGKATTWFAERGDAKSLFLGILFIILVLDGLFYASPIAAPRMIGTFGLLSLFVAALAVNACLLTLLSRQWRVSLIPIMFGLAAMFSFFNLNDNHELRTLRSEGFNKPDVRSSFNSWFKNRKDRPRYDKSDEYPVFIVAAQGGGIYASYQAAIVLARIEDRCPEFRDHLFAISSVSGGSVGAAEFVAALEATPIQASSPDMSKWCRSLVKRDARSVGPLSGTAGPIEKTLRSALVDDHLSPLIAATLFTDFTQRFLPFRIAGFDRARALEKSFEASLASKSGNRLDLTTRFSKQWTTAGSTPALLLNTTDAATGMRYLIAPFDVPAMNPAVDDRSVDNYPIWAKNADLRLSTAAVTSARFPFVTPAALVPSAAADASDKDRTLRSTRLVDGGYMDNSGVETALDVIAQLSAEWRSGPPNGVPAGAKPHFILIAITTSEIPNRTSSSFGETMEPVRALLSARTTRSYLALGRAYRDLKSAGSNTVYLNRPAITVGDFWTIPLSNQFYTLPLGWRLSKRTADIIDAQSGYGWDCDPGIDLNQRVEQLSKADCVQNMIAAEMSGTLDRAIRRAAINNYVPPARPVPNPRLPHEQFLRCILGKKDNTGKYADVPDGLSYVQARSGEAMLNEWDRRPDLTNDNWLAFMMAVMDSNTNHFSSIEEPGDDAHFITVRGPATRGGKLVGNISSDDAIRFKGRGFPFLTGRYNYDWVGRRIGFDLVARPEVMLNARISAKAMFAWVTQFYGRRLALILTTANPDWVAAWKITNPGEEVGASARVARYQRCIGQARESARS